MAEEIKGGEIKGGEIKGGEIKGAAYFPSIEKNYGKPIEHWRELVRGWMSEKPDAKHGELVARLKAEHAMGHGHATAVVASVKATR